MSSSAGTPDPLVPYRRLIGANGPNGAHGPNRSAADRVRWACTLEAVAPKVGNVHPSAAFADLQLSDFVVAGEQLAAVVGEAMQRPAEWPLGRTVLEAVTRCREQTGTNVNLGIALLVVPLVYAERLGQQQSCGIRAAMQEVLAGLDDQDGQDVYAAIRLAQPGGLGKVSEMDVSEPDPTAPDSSEPHRVTRRPVDLLAAMRSAAARDAVARQYATGFADLFDTLLPIIDSALREAGDLLIGIRRAQLRLLAHAPDTLIARKCGAQTALHGQRFAAEVVATVGESERAAAEAAFDAWLRADGHRRNPGTTADLIAAGLYVLLSEPSSRRDIR